MQIIHSPTQIQQICLTLRRQGKRIGFVPTMGNLHAGHLSLMQLAKANADVVVASIFVNPLQFGPNEDLDSYPRTFTEDVEKLQSLDVDYLFVPSEKELYPQGRDVTTTVNVNRLQDRLCGRSRPGHFQGVTTVVNLLFNLVQPHVAVFGKKDYQQLQIIRAMVSDLFIPVEILAGDIVREANGLAMSSRNQYLSAEEKDRASHLNRIIGQTAAQIEAGQCDYPALCQQAREALTQLGFKVDYFEIYNRHNLMPPTADDKELVILAAAWLGKPKLLDNREVERP